MLFRWLSLAPSLAQQPSPTSPAAALLLPEMLANAAALLHVVAHGASSAPREERDALRDVVQGPLEAASAVLDGPAGQAVRRAAETLAVME